MYWVCGVVLWIFGISGLLGFCGIEVVVIIGIFVRVVILVRVVVLVCSLVIGMFLIVWNRLFWWLISNMVVLVGLIFGVWLLKLVGVFIFIFFCRVVVCEFWVKFGWVCVFCMGYVVGVVDFSGCG